MKPARISGARRLAMATVAAGAVTALGATGAMAAPYATQASATALHLEVLGSAVTVDTGTELAQNDGSEESVIDSEEPLLSLLDGQSVITAGALGEVAVANNDGTSSACAGVTGEGGAVEVADPTDCITPGTEPVVIEIVDLLAVSARIEADAISATCTGAPDGTTSGGIDLVGARLVVEQPLTADVVVDLSTDVAPNTDVLGLLSPAVAALLSPLVSITLNEQAPLDPEETGDGYYGGLSVTALDVSAIGGGLANVELGNVTCGPSADLAIVPVVPLAGVPVALGTLAVIGGGVAIATTRRRRNAG